MANSASFEYIVLTEQFILALWCSLRHSPNISAYYGNMAFIFTFSCGTTFQNHTGNPLYNHTDHYNSKICYNLILICTKWLYCSKYHLYILYSAKQNCSRRHFNFLLLSFRENKACFSMWILCPAEDSLEISSLIFSEKQWKNIFECRLLQVVIGTLRVKVKMFGNKHCCYKEGPLYYANSVTLTPTVWDLSSKKPIEKCPLLVCTDKMTIMVIGTKRSIDLLPKSLKLKTLNKRDQNRSIGLLPKSSL